MIALAAFFFVLGICSQIAFKIALSAFARSKPSLPSQPTLRRH